MPDIFTTAEIGRLLGVETWRIRRLYEDGTLPETARFAGKRIIPSESIPTLIDCLRRRGWLEREKVEAER